MRLHILFEHDDGGRPHGASHIRLLRPFSHPSIDNVFQISSGLDLPQDEHVDVAVLERTWRPNIDVAQAQTLVQRLCDDNTCLLYMLDDNLLDLHRLEPWRPWPTEQHRLAIRYFIRQADGVIVSTENLRQRLLPLNPNIVVVPNSIDERLLSPRPKPPRRGTLRIGYMGTLSHTADLMMVLEPLRAFLRKHQDQVEMQLVGITSDGRIHECFSGLPLTVLDPGEDVNYPRFMAWMGKHLNWDFAIAPLCDSEFNYYKSDIKFLDYSVFGIPGIYSNVVPYTNTIRHRELGLLVDNTPEDWREAMELLYDEPELRDHVAAQAHDYVRTNRMLEQNAKCWAEAVSKLLSAAGKNVG